MKLGVQEQDIKESRTHERQVQHTQIRVQRLNATQDAIDRVSNDLETINRSISGPRGSVSLISDVLKILGRHSS